MQICELLIIYVKIIQISLKSLMDGILSGFLNIAKNYLMMSLQRSFYLFVIKIPQLSYMMMVIVIILEIIAFEHNPLVLTVFK